jgi:hypothetical protein
MKVRLDVLFMVGLLGLLLAAPARAQCLERVVQSVVSDFRQANQWPYPYLGEDRQAVPAPFAIMVENGWRRQNLLADHHFKNETDELNAAGEKMVRWILNEAPAQHRAIFVRRGDTVNATKSRLAAVEKFAAKASYDGTVPPITETTIRPAGYPADWPNAKDVTISRKWPINVPTNIYIPHATGDAAQK